MNAGLRGVVIAARFLADEHTMRIATSAIEHGIGDEPIVKNDVGLLEQLDGAKREQIGIAGTRADQVNLADLTGAVPSQLVREATAGILLITRKDTRPDDAADDPFPERPTLLRRKRLLHFLGGHRRKRARAPRRAGRSVSICCALGARRTGELPLRTDGHQHRRTVDDGWKDERRKLGIVDDVDGQPASLRSSRDCRIHIPRIGGCNDERDVPSR